MTNVRFELTVAGVLVKRSMSRDGNTPADITAMAKQIGASAVVTKITTVSTETKEAITIS